ncbi:hypothetical protein [Conexibacter sp. SYSU D00693]|uniref:hypothetical protein n=1 Tax=Conexibacter sp. SYSU D00693 TaxID=2812560 RepID=UPI00196B8708|nr:hypothetical protein [Conexibacter sp. SYSU D00693]
MPRTTLLAAPLALLALAPAAQAAPPWQPAGALGAAPSLLSVDASFGTGGPGVLFGSRDDRESFTRSVLLRQGVLAPLGADGAVGPQRVVASVDAPPVRYAGSRVVVARTQVVSARTPSVPRTKVGWSLGSVSASGVTVGTPRWLHTGGLSAPPVLTANARGDALLAWVETAPGAGTERLWLALKRAGGGLGRARVVRSAGGITGLAVDVAPNGRFAIAYQRTVTGSPSRGTTRNVEVRRGTVRGGLRAGVDTVGGSIGMAHADVAVASTGRTTVVYATQDLGEEANERQRVLSAVLPQSATGFAEAKELDRTARAARPAEEVRVEADETGAATAAWTSQDSQGRNVVRVATQDTRAAFGEPATVAAGDLRDLAVAPDGRAALVWSGHTGEGQDAGVLAALRPVAGAGFLPAEEVLGDALTWYPSAFAALPTATTWLVGATRAAQDGAEDAVVAARR